eukprot:3368033-Rhodomonas_salina.1
MSVQTAGQPYAHVSTNYRTTIRACQYKLPDSHTRMSVQSGGTTYAFVSTNGRASQSKPRQHSFNIFRSGSTA